jgi:hypothetical protein
MGIELYLFYEKYMLPASGRPGVVCSYSLTHPTEIPRAGYMATGALMLTIILTAMMYAALFAALLSILPTTATLKILAREMVGLENISTGTNLFIIGAWSMAVIFIALALKIGIRKRA